jgi:hypothetical protein
MQNQWLASDAAGWLYRIQYDPSNAPTATIQNKFTLPLQSQRRVLAVRTPPVPRRVVPAVRVRLAPSEPNSAKIPHADERMSEASGSRQSVPGAGQSVERLDSEDSEVDLEESRRALASVQESLDRAYETAAHLEESVARLKQLIAIQEARIKQSAVRERKSK